MMDSKFPLCSERFLKAGVMEGGTWRKTGAGAPQGGSMGPALANVCLQCAAGKRSAGYFARAAKGHCHMAGCADGVARASDTRKMPADAAGSSRRGLPNLGWIIR
jgi:hypothetical protein